MEELHLNDPDHNPTSSELLELVGLERSAAKEREPGSTNMAPSCGIEETHAEQFEIQTNPVNKYSEEVVLIEGRKWNDIPACQHFRGHTFEAEVSKLVMRVVRRCDQHEREQTALFIGNEWVQNCEKRFRRLEGKNYRTPIRFSTFVKKQQNEVPVLQEFQNMSYCTFVLFKDALVGT